MDLPDDVWMLVFDSLNENYDYYEPSSIIRWELAFLKCASKQFHQLCRAYLARYAKLSDDLFGEDPDLQSPDYLCTYLAYRGYLTCLTYAHQHGSPWDDKTTENAALGGNLSCLIYAREQGCAWNSRVCAAAAIRGHLVCLLYAIDNGCELDSDTTSSAIKGGHLNCFNYALSKQCKVERETIAATAIKHRQFEVFKHLVQEGYPVALETAKQAAISGNIECLRIALDKCPHKPQDLVSFSEFAVRAGSVESVLYLHQRGLPPNRDTLAEAIKSGRLDLVMYLHTNGFAWANDACDLAARNGHLNVLQYAHENGGLWDEITCAAAAERNLPILQYLHENKCPWDGVTIFRAAEHGSLACVKYAHEHGCPWHPSACDVTWSHEVKEYLHAHGCPCAHQPSAASE
jgi:hypothetical protein